MRQIILDTETTGLRPQDGERIAEICCLEVINGELTGNNFHHYIQPQKAMPEAVQKIHGLTDAFLADKPRFYQILKPFLKFVKDAELIIHNAPFDVDFINNEIRLANLYWLGVEIASKELSDICKITCTAQMARNKFPGQKASLDALCDRFGINREKRTFHNAMIDCELLFQVYKKLTQE